VDSVRIRTRIFNVIDDMTQDEGDLRLRELRLLHAENSIRSPCC
jgi:hypothetical protein